MVYGEGGINETNTIHQIGVLVCPRCHEFHYNLMFEPVEEFGGGSYTHVALCPKKTVPIFMVYDGREAILG